MPPLVAPLAFQFGGIIGFGQQDFLDLLDRLLPLEYLQPLKSPGPGYEIYQTSAAIGARVSTAIANFQLASFIASAPDGAFAQAVVLFSRPTVVAGAVTVKAGTIVQTAQYGRQFALMFDVPFGGSQLTAQGTVQALFTGEQYNVRGPYVTARGEAVPGEINQIVTWLQSPAFGDSTITVAQVYDAAGGVSPVLNQHGADRGFARGVNEPAAVYRQRIRTLPDTVSPSAMRNALAQQAASYPRTTWDFIETWQPSLQEAFDCPSPNAGVPNYQATIPSTINTNLFVYDDSRPAYPPYQGRWLDENLRAGAFVVTVPILAAIQDVGMAYDDTAQSPAALATANGSRAVNAYDVTYSVGGGVLQGAYDGQDFARNAAYLGLYNQLQRIKAAGVYVALEIQGF